MTIISAEVIYKSNVLLGALGTVIACSIIIGCAVCWAVRCKRRGECPSLDRFGKTISIIWMSTVVASFIVTCLACSVFRIPTQRYTYEVVFDNYKAIEEAMDKWEFVSYDNGIYTFKDKAE